MVRPAHWAGFIAGLLLSALIIHHALYDHSPPPSHPSRPGLLA
jgi:hypothetical protein